MIFWTVMQCGKSNNTSSMMVLAWLCNRPSSLVFVPYLFLLCFLSFCEIFNGYYFLMKAQLYCSDVSLVTSVFNSCVFSGKPHLIVRYVVVLYRLGYRSLSWVSVYVLLAGICCTMGYLPFFLFEVHSLSSLIGS